MKAQHNNGTSWHWLSSFSHYRSEPYVFLEVLTTYQCGTTCFWYVPVKLQLYQKKLLYKYLIYLIHVLYQSQQFISGFPPPWDHHDESGFFFHPILFVPGNHQHILYSSCCKSIQLKWFLQNTWFFIP